jgi:hypothetical protein
MFPNRVIELDCSRQLLAQLMDPQFQAALGDKYRNKVFWDNDLELSVWRSQPDGHRYEYYVAIRVFEQYGYLSLVEKYGGHGQRTHRVKREMVEQVAGEEVRELLSKTGVGGVQCPDLFVFTEDLKEWCFVEVKGPTDRVRPVQKAAFDTLEARTGKPWHVAEIRLVNP